MPVSIIPELENPTDRNAVAFSFGYEVRKVTDDKKQLQPTSFEMHNLRQYAIFAPGHDVLHGFNKEWYLVTECCESKEININI